MKWTACIMLGCLTPAYKPPVTEKLLPPQAANPGGRLSSLSNTTLSQPLERGFFPNESHSSDPLVSLTMWWSPFSVVTHGLALLYGIAPCMVLFVSGWCNHTEQHLVVQSSRSLVGQRKLITKQTGFHPEAKGFAWQWAPECFLCGEHWVVSIW